MCGRLAMIAFLSLLATAAGASTWTVQRDGTGDYTTIQPALDAAAAGDTILIGPGEYTEATTVRLPGWAYDIQSYAHLRCDNLTIIGAGADATVIGPPTYQANSDGNPASLSYSVGGGTLHISDLGLRHSYAMFVLGIVYMERCHFTNNKRGLVWDPSGPGGWVRDSVFETTEYIFDAESFEIGSGGAGSGILLERCRFDVPSVVRSVQGIGLFDCVFHGLDVYAASQVSIRRCTSTGSYVAVSLAMGGNSSCEIHDSDLSGIDAALWVTASAPGGAFSVENSCLRGGDYGAVYLAEFSGPCELRNCDLVKGVGPVVRCAANGPSVTHNLAGNYWGTTDEATIQSWIVDHTDDPNIGATVLYSPFAGQSVPTETTTWGDLKAQFR